MDTRGSQELTSELTFLTLSRQPDAGFDYVLKEMPDHSAFSNGLWT